MRQCAYTLILSHLLTHTHAPRHRYTDLQLHSFSLQTLIMSSHTIVLLLYSYFAFCLFPALGSAAFHYANII